MAVKVEHSSFFQRKKDLFWLPMKKIQTSDWRIDFKLSNLDVRKETDK